jgi:DNA-binding transcriptional LysR family regulator
VGAMLVVRSGRRISLTPAGEMLVAHAEGILARIAAAEADIADLAGMRKGQLRLASVTTAAATIMPPAIARFRREHPDVELSLAQAEVYDGLAGVFTGEYDIAIGHGVPSPHNTEEAVHQEHLLDDPLYVALPRRHRAAPRVRLRLAHLADEPWILPTPHGSPDAELLLEACRRAGFEARIAFGSDDFPAVQGFVAAGVGLALIPDMSAAISLRDDVTLRSLGTDVPPRRLTATMLKRQLMSPAVRAMLASLRASAQDWLTERQRVGFVDGSM